jgi:RNA polymerase sigma-70 factor, ECF subfamily
MHNHADPDPEQLLCLARMEDSQALGQLLDLYRSYLALLARLQVGRRLQGKVDASDVVQETFLEAYRHFPQFRGTTEAKLVSWLRQILAARLSKLVRRYLGTRRRDVRMESDLQAELDESSRVLDRGLVAPFNSPSEHYRGVMTKNSMTRLSDITDGTSNTLLLVEDAGRPKHWGPGHAARLRLSLGWGR